MRYFGGRQGLLGIEIKTTSLIFFQLFSVINLLVSSHTLLKDVSPHQKLNLGKTILNLKIVKHHIRK